LPVFVKSANSSSYLYHNLRDRESRLPNEVRHPDTLAQRDTKDRDSR